MNIKTQRTYVLSLNCQFSSDVMSIQKYHVRNSLVLYFCILNKRVAKRTTQINLTLFVSLQIDQMVL